ncbi:MAG TPA: quinoprotein dehydrogenase-associated putative ABC transporter substrate-binding protein [Terriglobales bacterium]|nr:quinoprotein dehydrogenase-associated putative ABC transporter substrate-binding protein [Terriglobales bacterium]
MLLLVVTCVASKPLKVCADPNNLPYSNRAGKGYENRIAELLAAYLHRNLVYQWSRMDRGFVREFLNTGECDVLVEVPANFAPVLVTAPFYKSTYVFVTRRPGRTGISSFDDPQLRKMKIGLQILGDDYASPGIALTRRGLAKNIVGFEGGGNDPGKIIRAVSAGNIDVAIVWGPLAGYYARSTSHRLRLTPVPALDAPAIPFRYQISMAVKKGNRQLQQELSGFLISQKTAIENVLREYGVPLLDVANPQMASARGGS